MEVNRILLPTDFSDCSAKAAICAVQFTKTFDAELHILFVLEDSLGKLPTNILPPPGEVETDLASVANDELSQLLGVNLDQLTRVYLATSMGPIDFKIVQYAEEHKIDMIVMGTHGRSGLGHMLMGSVAETVVRKSKCPVMTVRPDS